MCCYIQLSIKMLQSKERTLIIDSTQNILPKSMAARFFCCSEDKGFVMAIEEISLLPAADELPKKESPFNIEFVSV